MTPVDHTLLRQLTHVTRDLALQQNRSQTLQAIVDGAVDTVPGCEYAGVSLRRGKGVVETPASTHDLVRAADESQYALGEGPCLDAIWVDDTYLIDDLTCEQRWPRWTRHAISLGIRGVLSVRVSTPAGVMGGLNLYSCRPHAFDEDAVHVAHGYAQIAATALEVVTKAEGLQTALQTRHMIGVAQGILMKRFQLDIEGSFALLKRYSQTQNVRLRDVATQIVKDARDL